jgi:hypothetical protein
MFGSFKGTLVKNIVIESTLAENCRRVRQVVKAWGRMAGGANVYQNRRFEVLRC